MARFCTYCGAPCTDTAMFCTKCGSKLIPAKSMGEVKAEAEVPNVEEPAEQVMEEAVEKVEEAAPQTEEVWEKTVVTPEEAPEAAAEESQPEETAVPYESIAGAEVKEKKPKFKLSKKLIIPICAAAAALIVILVLVNVLGKRVDLTKYVDINIEGPSGYATASADVNDDELSVAVLKALGRKVNSVEDLYNSLDLSLFTDAGKVQTVLSGIDITLDETENIANGDEVTATIKFTGDAKSLGISVKDGTKKVKAADLPEATEVDPFSKLTVTFTGVDGYGEVQLEEDSDDFSFYLDEYNYELKNGDTVKVIADYNARNLLSKNMVATASEKEYTVSGLQEAEEVDLFSAITLTFEGVDHYGEATIENNGDYDDYYVWYDIDKDYDLSNGDTVTVTADFDEEYLAMNGLIAQAAEKTYTVEGLKEVEEIDIFADVQITYEGISPFAYAYIDGFYDDNDVYYSFELDKSDNLAVGDKITVTASFDEEQLAKAGFTAASKTKEFTVGNIDSYITKVEDLTEADMKTIQKACTDFLANDLANYDTKTFTHSESYYGMYVMTGDITKGYDGNVLVPVFQGKVADSSADYKVPETTVYYAFFIQEAYHKADGTLVYDTDIKLFQPEKGINTSIGELYIFTDGKQLYNDVVVQYKDIVTYVMTDNLKQFGE